jgi:hypothetical protein
MGAQQSTSEMPQKKTLSSTIDYLAANYILSSNFQDLKNLTDPKYCKNLVILTSDVIARYLSETELNYLKQRLEGGVEVLKMTDTPEKIAYFNQNNLDKMDIKSDLKKKRMCIAIAKYYVQIFHLFNAIAHTINPVYTWKDQFGSTVSVDYEHRNDIPANVQPTISKINLCSTRINALMKDKAPLDSSSSNQMIDIKASFCSLNANASGNPSMLSNEPGIPELETLYYDVYDYNTGKFTAMSNEMLEQYNADVKTFYTLFTGKEDIPKNITKFGQIPLRNYQKITQCQPNGAFTKTYKGTLKEKLFKDYVDNVKTMMKNTEDNQNELLAIIDQLFAFVKDPQDPTKKLVVIHPKLDNKLLANLITTTRTTILKLYTTCEQDFFKGLQIFEALVEKQIIDTSTSQIKQLQQNVEDTVSLDTYTDAPPIVEQALKNAPVEVPTNPAEPAPIVEQASKSAPVEVPTNPAEPAPIESKPKPTDDKKMDEPITSDPKPI